MTTLPTSAPYLILHKVRGEPAFDIAVNVEIDCEGDPGPWWIIPTSGHRAYPAMEWPLRDLLWSPTTYDPPVPVDVIAESVGIDYLRDHYESDNLHLHDPAPTKSTFDLLALIGKAVPATVTRRR